VTLVAASSLAHPAALYWYQQHIWATAGAALTVFGDVAMLKEFLAICLIGYAGVIGLLSSLLHRGPRVRLIVTVLLALSVPVQLLLLSVHLHDSGHVFTAGIRVGDPTPAILATILATTAAMLLTTAAALWLLRRPRTTAESRPPTAL
jgi:uncharacterized membrane protein YbhN (UPF0104 family)